MKTLRVNAEQGQAGMLLLEFLASELDLSRKRAKELLNRRDVTINGRRIWMARHALHAGDTVAVTTVTGSKGPIEILFEDNDYLVVNKKPGLLSNGPGSVEDRIREQTGNREIQVAHRLDRDTSGCLLLARNTRSLEAIVACFDRRTVSKSYHTLVVGSVNSPALTMKQPLEGRSAFTHARVLDSNRAASHLQVSIKTGRTHQIRRHLAALGHPVLGDRHYALKRVKDKRIQNLGRQMLHASAIDFQHPRTSRRIRVKAPLPNDFRNALKALGLS